MNNSLPDIQQLRNNIDFASIAQFFHTFQSAFHPWPVTSNDIIYPRTTEPNEYVFETEDLERMILDVSERLRFEDLLVRMLRLLTRLRFINSSNWQTYFSKEFDKREYDHINPFHTEENELDQQKKELVNYFSLPLETKVHLLHLLCEWQLDDPERFRDNLDSEDDAVQWRVDPIGFDKKGSTFWLFDDNRMYKETPKSKPTKKSTSRRKKRVPAARRSSRKNTRSSNTITDKEEEGEQSEDEEEWMPWKLVCATKQEWEQIPLKYANSKNVDEQRFHQLLVEDLLPKILPALDEHEKEIKRQEALMHRKRSSRIMIKELESLERPEELGAHSARISNRIEKKAQEKEQQEKERLAKAREERLLERERRIQEREYRALTREKQQPIENAINVEEPAITERKAKSSHTNKKADDTEQKPKRKYTKRPKFDEHGNPIPRKVKLDKDGNPIPLKKRGRKPKNRDLVEETWVFDCECGIHGQNLDDGTPMIACEKCGIWQHIKCLQKSGHVEKTKSMDNITFICHKCMNKQDNTLDDAHQNKKQRINHHNDTVPSSYHPLPSMQSTWQPQHQSSAVRGNHQPIADVLPSAQHAYYPPSASVLPPIRASIPLPQQQQQQQQQQYPYYPAPSYSQLHTMHSYSPTPGTSTPMIYQQQPTSNFAPINTNTGQANMTPPRAVHVIHQPTSSHALPGFASPLPTTNSLPLAVPTPRVNPLQPTIQSMVSQSTTSNVTFIKENSDAQNQFRK